MMFASILLICLLPFCVFGSPGRELWLRLHSLAQVGIPGSGENALIIYNELVQMNLSSSDFWMKESAYSLMMKQGWFKNSSTPIANCSCPIQFFPEHKMSFSSILISNIGNLIFFVGFLTVQMFTFLRRREKRRKRKLLENKTHCVSMAQEDPLLSVR